MTALLLSLTLLVQGAGVEASPNVEAVRGLEETPRTVAHVRSGSATWYCCTIGHGPGELVAAAGPALRIGRWRGRIVWVNGLRVRLVDWCRCPNGRVIDLHPGAFRRLAPLSRGVTRVRVTW